MPPCFIFQYLNSEEFISWFGLKVANMDIAIYELDILLFYFLCFNLLPKYTVTVDWSWLIGAFFLFQGEHSNNNYKDSVLAFFIEINKCLL